MQPNLKQLRERALKRIKEASDITELEELRVRYLGRKGEITGILRSVKDLPQDQRKAAGQQTNLLKKDIGQAVDERIQELQDGGSEKISLDLTLPGRRRFCGTKHPLTIVRDRIVDIFVGMGFSEILGPEMESDWYNFEALNIPEGHPARGEMFGNFYLSNGMLLRSHTSPVQIRTMEKTSPPVRVIAPGRVFRRDAFDASHSPDFSQVEGLYVDEGVSMGDLKGTLQAFCTEMFGEDTRIDLSPSYFPFTEPSAELSISCVICGGKGCSVCKQTGWIEILGCGMVHPQVLRNVGYDPQKVSGYAFGMGIERIAMIRYRINDIRHFFTNNLRFLNQFQEL